MLGHHISYRFIRHMPLARDITLTQALSLRKEWRKAERCRCRSSGNTGNTSPGASRLRDIRAPTSDS